MIFVSTGPLTAANVDLISFPSFQEILYGHFISSIINFILMAFVLFLLLKFVNKLFSLTVKKEEEKKEEPKKEEPPKKSDEVLLLEEIRDLLKKNAK